MQTILARRPDVADAINKRHKNPDYLKEFDLPANLAATTDPVVALAGADFIIHCVPLQASTRFLQGVREHIPARAPIVSTSKGLDVGTLNLMSEIIQDALGAEHPNCYVSGPSFAKVRWPGHREAQRGVAKCARALLLVGDGLSSDACNRVSAWPADVTRRCRS